MLSSDFTKLIRPLAITLNIIWGALLAAPFIYVFIAWIMFGIAEGKAEPAAGDLDPFVIQAVLAVVAVLLAAVSFFYRKRALADENLRSKMEVDIGTGPAGGSFNANQLVALQEGAGTLPTAEQRLVNIFPHYQTTTIIVLTMREAIAVFGFVLAIVTGTFTTVVPWAAVAFVLMASQPPAVKSFMERTLRLARSY